MNERTRYRIYRSTSVYAFRGRTSTTHSWWCEQQFQYGGTYTTPHWSWRDAIDYAYRQAKQVAA